MLLDQNVADEPLPVCSRVPAQYPSSVVTAPDAAPVFTHDELRALRDESASWLAGLDADLDGHGAGNIPAELDTADTDPAPPPESEQEPNT
jgi:hypothetical protein